MDTISAEIFTDIHTRYVVESDLVKRVLEILFPTQKSWLHFCQSLYWIFAPHIRDLMIVQGGSIIDHYIGHYRQTDFDVMIASADVYHDMQQFLLKNGFDSITCRSPVLVDRDRYTETPIGDLSAIGDYINELIHSYPDQIIQAAKNFLYNIFRTDEKFSIYSRLKPNYVELINRQSIGELTLGEMDVTLLYFDDKIITRLAKRLNMTIMHEPSNMEKPDQFLRLHFIDIAVSSSSISWALSASIYFFPCLSLEYYLIDYVLTVIKSWDSHKLKLRLERLEKIIDLVLSKNSKISVNLLKELIDLGMNVIDLDKPVGVGSLIGHTGNVYDVASFTNSNIDHGIDSKLDRSKCRSLIELIIEILKMNDLQLMDAYDIFIEEPNVKEKLDAARKHTRNGMRQLFRLITQSPYFHEHRLLYANDT